jgi:hypothetical protein
LLSFKNGNGKGDKQLCRTIGFEAFTPFSSEKEIQRIHIFGDSMNVINWAIKHQICHKNFLSPILEDIYRLMDMFDTLVISHVYRDMNMVADSMSKDGLLLSLGQWHITEKKGEDTNVFFHQPFIEDHDHL